jgi:hypothetical protein
MRKAGLASIGFATSVRSNDGLRPASAAFTLETHVHVLDDRAGVDAWPRPWIQVLNGFTVGRSRRRVANAQRS